MCSHVDEIRAVTARTPEGCQECLEAGEAGNWFHLRMCLTCGHVGCCDSSAGKHASQHYAATGHPIVQSFQPGEDWGWCFADDELLLAAELVPPR